MSMKKSIVIFLGVMMLTASPVLGAEKIKIATEGAYSPFNYVNPKGDLEGFDVDIAKALCEAMKADCTLVTQDWDGIIPALLAKKFDVIVASMAVTEKRKKAIAFTNPYYYSVASYVVRKESNFPDKAEALVGKTIGVQRATIHEGTIKEMYGDKVTIKTYDTNENCILDLKNKRLDAMIASRPLMAHYIKHHPESGFAFLLGMYNPVHAGIGLRKQDSALVEKFNAALNTIVQNGTYEQISNKWFGESLLKK
ncbi:MAG TPA: transporter substrate-binding domain-containing protein [Deltaproteobacteria bacterium]|nr:transporter substrate-binding domain-containing protein [Deltaproteobacteria bacterium]